MKRGQLTIFIIVGILIVASVSFFFVSRAGLIPGIGGSTQESNVNSFLNTCLEGNVRDAIDLILKNGGYLKPQFSIDFLFEDAETATEITYLCYNQNDYFPCVNQEPLLFKNAEKEITDFIFDDVSNCFDDLEESLDRQNFEVSGPGLKEFKVELKPGQVILQLDSELTLSRAGETTTEKDYQVNIPTKLYEILNVVNEAVNKEATACDFDYRGYEFLYPQYEIKKMRRIDQTSDIYTIEHLDTNEKFMFAIRGCVIPPGL